MKQRIERWCRRFLSAVRALGRSIRHLLLKTDVERLLTLGYTSALPQRRLLVGYLVYFLIGAFLLLLPFMRTRGVPFVDQLFTSMSAISTTGLMSVSITDYTFWGQLVILLLIQLGGLGYMTISTFAMYHLTRHFMGTKAKEFHAQFAIPETMRPSVLVNHIVGFTFLFELAGTVLLYLLFMQEGVEQPLWCAVFHSVSAFCTAGFSVFPEGLVRFTTNIPVNAVIITLSYAGAMGFIVISDLWRKLTVRRYRVTFTTKVIVSITTIVTLWGTMHLFFFEPSFRQFAPGERVLVSVFQTMSAMTTVGFNTVNMGAVVPLSLLVLTMIMYIGASPSGTGGGLKSTTLSAVYAFVKCKLGLRKEITFAGHHIPHYRVETALTTFVFYTVILWLGIYLLSLSEADDMPILSLIFEAASALGTVGLSSGVTASLSAVGKIILIALMFIGRVGVLTLGIAFLARLNRRPQSTDDEDLAV